MPRTSNAKKKSLRGAEPSTLDECKENIDPEAELSLSGKSSEPLFKEEKLPKIKTYTRKPKTQQPFSKRDATSPSKQTLNSDEQQDDSGISLRIPLKQDHGNDITRKIADSIKTSKEISKGKEISSKSLLEIVMPSNSTSEKENRKEKRKTTRCRAKKIEVQSGAAQILDAQRKFFEELDKTTLETASPDAIRPTCSRESDCKQQQPKDKLDIDPEKEVSEKMLRGMYPRLAAEYDDYCAALPEDVEPLTLQDFADLRKEINIEPAVVYEGILD